MEKRRILIIEDRANTLKVLTAILTKAGYQVFQAANGRQAMAVYQEQPELDIILSDLKLPATTGLELYQRFNHIRPCPPFVIMTAYGTVQSAVQALKIGISDYLIKPLNFDEMLLVLDKAVQDTTAAASSADDEEGRYEASAFHGIIGTSRPMQAIFELVQTVGPTDASVMIYGETGTGKELIARALHAESPRRHNQMVSINCAALTENLLEAELFGYRKGAFTGAVTDRKGRLEVAHKGTLFLDEIGHMSLPLQAKLLRFAERKTFQPVGGNQTHKVDVRLIAATNMDLQQAIAEERFLSDLLYRLEVIRIHVSALRERQADIPLLVNHFVRLYGRQYGKPARTVGAEVLPWLLNYTWPGNVRELKNQLARAVILSKDRQLAPADFPNIIKFQGNAAQPPQPANLIDRLPEPGAGIKLQELEAAFIRKTLETCNGNKSMAAKMLGISRKGLYQKMARYGID